MARKSLRGSISLEEHAYQKIRNMIIHGELQPGEQIVQEDLAERLGVSRTPLRHALAELAKDHFVDLIPRGGAYVRRFGDAELISMFEIRAVLEGLVGRLIAPTIAPKHIAFLRSLITGAADSVTQDNWTEYRAADVEFHTYLANLAEDRMLSQILNSYQILSLSLAQGLLRPPSETQPEHLAILDALEQRSPEQAEEAMRVHIRNTLDRMRGKPQSSATGGGRAE